MFCIIKDLKTGYFYGKEFDEGYHYSEYTNSDASVNTCWEPLQFFMGPDKDDSCGLVIFETEKAAVEYMAKEWSSKDTEVIFIKDLNTGLYEE